MNSNPQPIAERRDFLEIALVNTVLVLALILFGIGIWAPMLTVTKLWWLSDTLSVLTAIEQLARAGEWFLSIVILVFSVVFPGAKLVLLFYVWNRSVQQRSRKLLHWVNISSKWSMLDVFVVAVLVASIKMDALTNLELHYGLYVFAAAVLLIMLITHWIARRLG